VFLLRKAFFSGVFLTGKGMAHWEKAAQKENARCLFEILHKEKAQAGNF
jgi:hypothetical protein